MVKSRMLTWFGRTLRVALLGALGAGILVVSAETGALEEVPFITTPDRVTLAMIDIARVGAQDHLIDLGSGDGRIVITAAAQRGASGLGVEIVPDLVERSRAAALRAGVQSRTRFEVQDLFQTDLTSATVITMYLLPDVNLRLRPALLRLRPGTRVVSHDWDMGDWLPDESITLEVPEKTIGREKVSRVHLWVVPAPLQGRWCAQGRPVVEVEARHQVAQVRMLHETAQTTSTPSLTDFALPLPPIQGRIRGASLDLLATPAAIQLQWESFDRVNLRSAAGGQLPLDRCVEPNSARADPPVR